MNTVQAILPLLFLLLSSPQAARASDDPLSSGSYRSKWTYTPHRPTSSDDVIERLDATLLDMWTRDVVINGVATTVVLSNFETDLKTERELIDRAFTEAVKHYQIYVKRNNLTISLIDADLLRSIDIVTLHWDQLQDNNLLMQRHLGRAYARFIIYNSFEVGLIALWDFNHPKYSKRQELHRFVTIFHEFTHYLSTLYYTTGGDSAHDEAMVKKIENNYLNSIGYTNQH